MGLRFKAWNPAERNDKKKVREVQDVPTVQAPTDPIQISNRIMTLELQVAQLMAMLTRTSKVTGEKVLSGFAKQRRRYT